MVSPCYSLNSLCHGLLPIRALRFCATVAGQAVAFFNTATMKDTLERLMDNIWQEDNSGCWIWVGSITDGGNKQPRPRFHVDGKQQLAYRVMFAIHHKCSLLPDTMICHKCDNTICVNPAHLFPGTVLDNARDMISKRRGFWHRGTGPCAKNKSRIGYERDFKNASGFRGVYKNKDSFTARIRIMGSYLSLGTFNTIEEAGAAYLGARTVALAQLAKLEKELK